jgi:hypothetical protein
LSADKRSKQRNVRLDRVAVRPIRVVEVNEDKLQAYADLFYSLADEIFLAKLQDLDRVPGVSDYLGNEVHRLIQLSSAIDVLRQDLFDVIGDTLNNTRPESLEQVKSEMYLLRQNLLDAISDTKNNTIRKLSSRGC